MFSSMCKMRAKKGFTLAELLVVIAIIVVLVAIAIPVFSGAIDSANDAVMSANYRAAKAEAAVKYMLKGETGTKYYTYKVDGKGNIELNGPSDSGSDAPEDSTSGGVMITGEVYELTT